MGDDIWWHEMNAIEGRYEPLLEKYKLQDFKDGLWQVHLKTEDSKQFEIDLLEGLIQYGETQLQTRFDELKGITNIPEEENAAVQELAKRETERKKLRDKIKHLMKEKGDELAQCDREEAQELSEALDEFAKMRIKERYDHVRVALEKDMKEYRNMLLDT